MATKECSWYCIQVRASRHHAKEICHSIIYLSLRQGFQWLTTQNAFDKSPSSLHLNLLVQSKNSQIGMWSIFTKSRLVWLDLVVTKIARPRGGIDRCAGLPPIHHLASGVYPRSPNPTSATKNLSTMAIHETKELFADGLSKHQLWDLVVQHFQISTIKGVQCP